MVGQNNTMYAYLKSANNHITDYMLPGKFRSSIYRRNILMVSVSFEFETRATRTEMKFSRIVPTYSDH